MHPIGIRFKLDQEALHCRDFVLEAQVHPPLDPAAHLLEYPLKRLLDTGRPPEVVTKTRRMLLPSVAGRYTPQKEATDIIAQR